ncbi:hypothetical protein [Streptomyces sp. NPDC088270]|uniref:hypothetical protein n=1 Tax=Streptomyces sp. NPDC088270 TaxID=3160990 RepID=UPI0034340371
MDHEEVRRYSYWGEVPTSTYMTKSQLQRLTMPRQPGGPVRARVEGRDGAGRKGVFDLYLVSESEPTSSSVAQLAAAAARRTTADRICDECGARPDQPCTPWGDTGRPLCQTCAHIERLRAAQHQAADRRAHVQRQAADLLDHQALAVLHVTYTTRGTTESGRRRPPSAAHVTALAPDGRTLIDARLRLVPPRSKGIPEDAVDPEAAAEEIRAALAPATVVVWADALGDLSAGLSRLGIPWPVPSGYGRRHDLCQMTAAWRGDIGHKTGSPRMPVAPGRADRMLYLLQEMAQARP